MSDPNLVPENELTMNPDPLRTIGVVQGSRRGGKTALAERPERLPDVAPDDFVPLRIWTAGPGTPQEKILIPGTSKALKPGTGDYAYHARTPLEVEALQGALPKGRWWPDNIDPGEPSLECQICHWTCRNYNAYMWHTNNAHGRDRQYP